jgi:hypothetical protein
MEGSGKMHSEISLDRKKALARQFLPTLRFDKREPYTPTNFIELFRKENGEIDFTCSKPSKHWREKAKFDEKTNLFWFKPAVYVHFLENKAILIRQKTLIIPLIIQYWYYFSYNGFYLGELEIPFLEHPHDWEWIQLALIKSEKDEYKLLSYSVSAHGTGVGVSDRDRLEIYKQEGFHVTRGSHNFASIFQVINKSKHGDTVISPDTVVSGNCVFKDTLIFLDAEYTEDFLAKFSFFPLLAAWERDLYKKTAWLPEYWTFSAFHRFLELSRGVDDFYQKATHRKV